MDRRYKHLNGEERGVILAEHRRGASLQAIGLLLGRSASTIGRELRRGRPDGLPAQPYCPQFGGAAYRARRQRCGRRRKLVEGRWLHDWVRGRLIHRRWSPEQIACRLRAMHPEDPTRLISHVAIHAAICAQPRGGRCAGMIAALRQHKPARGLRRTTLSGGSIAPESLRIIHRPEEIEGRLVPGHLEGDLIKGAFNRSAIGTVTGNLNDGKRVRVSWVKEEPPREWYRALEEAVTPAAPTQALDRLDLVLRKSSMRKLDFQSAPALTTIQILRCLRPCSASKAMVTAAA